MFISRLLWAAVMFFWATTALSGTRDPNTPDEKYLEFGKQFPSVVRMRSTTTMVEAATGETKPTFQYGSAVVIKPHWVLTAAHVVHNTTDPTAIADNDKKYPLQKVIIPPEFHEDKIGYYDVALCYSSEDFQLAFYTPLYKKTDEMGKAITIAGYGVTGTFNTGYTISDGKKRAGHNKVEARSRGTLICFATSGRNRMPLEYMISPGDSGGGMFIGNELAGINSFISAADKIPNGTYGDESAFTRISLYADWVESQIEKYELALQARVTTGGEINFNVAEVNLPDQPADESIELILP